MNPAVTLAMAIFRGFSWAEVPVYWAAQFLGAFAGALVVYVSNYSAIQAVDAAKTIGIFITGRQTDAVSTTAAFIAEFLGTALLVLVILSTSDKGNTPAGNTQPLIIGLSLAAIGTSFGYETGFALNPARDLAPRLFTALFGWGFEAFSRQGWYFWVPIVAPFFGAIGGAFSKSSLSMSMWPSVRGGTICPSFLTSLVSSISTSLRSPHLRQRPQPPQQLEDFCFRINLE